MNRRTPLVFIFTGFAILVIVVFISAKIIQSRAEDAAIQAEKLAHSLQENRVPVQKTEQDIRIKQIPDLTTQRFVGPAPESVLTKEVFQSFKLEAIRSEDLSKQAADYAGLQNIQYSVIRSPKGETYLVYEFVIRDRDALMYSLGDSLLTVGDRTLYLIRASGGMYPSSGLFLVSESRAIFIDREPGNWNVDTDPEIIDFLQHVSLP